MPASKGYKSSSKPSQKAKSQPPKANKPKRTDHSKNETVSARRAEQLPLDLQQLVLDTFKTSFSTRLQSGISPLLQEIKQHLFNRDFDKAFSRDDYLEAYAARWSPSRALGYLQVLNDLRDYLVPRGALKTENPWQWRVVCLGGGAGAEVVAFAAYQHFLLRRTDPEKTNQDETSASKNLEIGAIDVADWSTVLKTLEGAVTTVPPSSLYVRPSWANEALLPCTSFHLDFHKHDLLAMKPKDLSLILASANLITIMFTLNELYSASMALTQSILLTITALTSPGVMLLIVDSPGSYSTVKLGEENKEKTYPMHWLLEHMLLESASDEHGKKAWERLVSEESVWFRMSEELRYPIELEDMRYQVHLYLRI